MFIHDFCIFLYGYCIFLYDFWTPCPPWVYPNSFPQQYIMWLLTSEHEQNFGHDPKMNPNRSKIGNRETKLDQNDPTKPILGSKWAFDIRNILKRPKSIENFPIFYMMLETNGREPYADAHQKIFYVIP